MSSIVPINPEAIGVFGLFVTVICFGLEQVGVGIDSKTDHAKLTRTLAYIALVFGCVCQLVTAAFMFLYDLGGEHSKFLGNIFGFFGLFWLFVAIYFLKGGDKKMMAIFFAVCLIFVLLFTYNAFIAGLIWPLGIDLIVIDILLITLTIGWWTDSATCTKIAGVCNLVIGGISFFLMYPHVLTALGAAH